MHKPRFSVFAAQLLFHFLVDPYFFFLFHSHALMLTSLPPWASMSWGGCFRSPLLAFLNQQLFALRSVLSFWYLREGWKQQGRRKMNAVSCVSAPGLVAVRFPTTSRRLCCCCCLLCLKGGGGGAGLLTYLYSRPLSRKRNKALSRFGMLWSKRRGREPFMLAFPQILEICRLPGWNMATRQVTSSYQCSDERCSPETLYSL